MLERKERVRLRGAMRYGCVAERKREKAAVWRLERWRGSGRRADFPRRPMRFRRKPMAQQGFLR